MKKVLVVEDHPLVAAATESLFRAMGVDEIVLCSNAEDAISTLEKQQDWFRIFLDIGVPGADGLSLIRHVSRLGFAGRSAVITGSDRPDWLDEVKASGFLAYVVKTANAPEFSHAVQEIMAGRKIFSRADLPPQSMQLTRKQTEVLALFDQGLSVAAMSRNLGIPEQKTKSILQAMVHALRDKNADQALRIQARLGES